MEGATGEGAWISPLDRSCLPSIAEHGLLSWVGLDKEDIGGRKGSSELSRALDTSKGLGDFVRLSFTTRHPMMYVAQKDGRLLDPVVLEIHLSVVLIPGCFLVIEMQLLLWLNFQIVLARFALMSPFA